MANLVIRPGVCFKDHQATVGIVPDEGVLAAEAIVIIPGGIIGGGLADQQPGLVRR